MTDPEKKPTYTKALPGLAVLACVVTGLAGWFFTLGTHNPIFLLASAVAFGVVVIASFK